VITGMFASVATLAKMMESARSSDAGVLDDLEQAALMVDQQHRCIIRIITGLWPLKSAMFGGVLMSGPSISPAPATHRGQCEP